MTSELEVANIVGSADLGIEIDLDVLEEELDVEDVFTRQGGLYFKFESDSPTMIVARTGTYIITGADSTEVLDNTRKKVLQEFTDINLIDKPRDNGFSINNIVYSVDTNNEIDLTELSIVIGFEQVEYEPEQFPGLIYRPEGTDSVGLIFSTGKMVITGATNRQEAEEAYSSIENKLQEVH
jgi:transcription initiation factor TFIID TATA-box-binding protein